MLCDRSHQTVAFCFRISATYDVGLLLAADRPDVDLRGRPDNVDEFVGCLCIVMLFIVDVEV
jgi:hypothetical protein